MDLRAHDGRDGGGGRRGALWFHHAHTGLWWPASGRARILAARLDAWWLGPIPFDPTPTRRLLAYLPIGVGAALGVTAVLRSRQETGLGSATAAHARVWRLLVAMSLVFLALYSTVLGAAHFGRYAIFVMPALVLLAARGWRRMLAAGADRSRSAARGRRAALLAVAWLVVVFAGETIVRARSASHRMVAHLRAAPVQRGAETRRLLAELGDPPPPVVVALVEVQVRYALDSRVVVRSLDGRVDPRLLDFASAEGIDHLAYLRDRRAVALLGLPGAGTLEPLRDLGSGQTRTLDGLRFRRLAGEAPRYALSLVAAEGR